MRQFCKWLIYSILQKTSNATLNAHFFYQATHPTRWVKLQVSVAVVASLEFDVVIGLLGNI